MQLRDYQQEAVDALYSWFGDGKGNPLVVAPTGAGKSVILSEFIRSAVVQYPGTKVIAVTHVKELIQQNAKALLRMWPAAPVGIYSAGLNAKQAGRQITFAGIQSVAKKAAQFGSVDLIVVDECFPAGTQIKTPCGSVEIQDVKVGQIVENACGIGVVEATMVSDAAKLVRIKLNDGSIIKCTENHPIFTETGWTKAGKLEVGRRLFSSEDLRALRCGISPVDQAGRERGSDLFDEAGSLEKAAFLLNILLEESGKRDARSGRERENDSYTTSDWSSPLCSVGQRSRTDEAASGALELAGRRMDSGARGCDWRSEGRGIADCVQDRHCTPGNDDCDRGGRTDPLREADTGRPKKRCNLGGSRVVSVSHQEQVSTIPVYNLQVSGHPSYFAGGALVHNCHLIPRNPKTLYGKFFDAIRAINPAVKIVGLSATPFRLDSGRLDAGDDALFDGIAYDIPVAMLVKRGYLSPLISKRPDMVFDTSGLHKRGGDYIEGEMDARFNTDDVTRQAVVETIAFGKDRKSWLLFCISVSHAIAVRDELISKGISAATVTGDTPPADRARILEDFKAGRLRAITNVNVLTTGFDAPATDLLAFLRPTQSLGLYMQMAGRAMRTAHGKENGLVLDFAGNVAKHGPVDAVMMPDDKPKGKGDGEAPTKTCPTCQEIVFAGARECGCCGYEFPPPEIKIEHTASTDAIMNMTAHEDWLPVNDFALERHDPRDGRPVSLRVEYLVNGKVIKEWVCLEHTGFPRQKAVQWWHQNAGTTPPETVDQALDRRAEVRIPAEVVVRREGKFQKIVRARGGELRGAA